MAVAIFAQNRLETASAVAVNPAAASGRPITRIYDRIRARPYEGGSAAQTDIDIDLGASPPAVTALAILGHNVTGVTISIRADTTSPGTTERATIVATGADALVTFASLTFRHWRVRIPVMASAPQVGELLLGVHRAITVNPVLESAGKATVGNVVRRRSPGNYTFATRLSPSLAGIAWRWSHLTAADVTTLRNAYADAEEGVKNVLVQDEDGALYWTCWTSGAIRPVPVVPNPAVGSEVYEVGDITFEGAA